MKFKKLLISASAIAAGSGLLATVLTSCAKANVDAKLKIKLDDNGLLYKAGKMGQLSYKEAITAALTRSNNWAQFKNALADEVVYQWFTNRMSDKGSDQKNTSFRTSFDEWSYSVNKDYNSIVQKCKDKYGANWGFYLRNEYLAPLGGTEAAYKHAKLVEKVKTEFISKVFNKNYFGYKLEADSNIYPIAFTKATKDINKNILRNPDNWGNIGFFARAELSFDPGVIPQTYADYKVSYFAKHPDGDYAAIQDYVFNRWFKTEKPFFADGALFKYSNPKYVAGGKLDQIYNATRTGVKVPEKPNEAFPFFGAGDESSTRKAVDFLADMEANKFATKYNNGGTEVLTNHTITIPLADSDDTTQTCLLVTGNQMFTALYTPYAMACGNLYAQMMDTTGTVETSPHRLTLAEVKANLGTYEKGKIDDFALLKNFFFNTETLAAHTGIDATKVLDLKKLYGSVSATGNYHCPLFSKCETYDWFYGNDETGANAKNGIQYITNNVQVDDFATRSETQPWVLELNEAGIHFLTIDGSSWVTAASTADAKLDRLNKLVKYRLMQKQTNDDAAPCISTDLLGESGKLKTYFNDNFANIILEMATTNVEKWNVFRKIESYNKAPGELTKNDHLFLVQVCTSHALNTDYTALTAYLTALDEYEQIKKNSVSLQTANDKIYAYRSKQIAASKAGEEFSKTVFENGLLAPFVYTPVVNATNNIMYDYSSVNRVTIQGYEQQLAQGFNNVLSSRLTAISSMKFVTDAASAAVNGTSGFSPQIASAKKTATNRFWYKSSLVDKVMYSYMGNKANTANQIKMNAYNYYASTLKADEWFGTDGASGKIWGSPAAANAFETTYARSKLLAGEKNLASYLDSPAGFSASDFYSLMDTNFFGTNGFLQKAFIENGMSADEIANYALFKATVMYLVDDNFKNFYTLFNSKISEDEAAIVGYLTKGYTTGAGRALSETPIVDISQTAETDYDFNANVDNMFDKFGYSGEARSEETTDSQISTTSYWNVVKKTFANGPTSKDFAGFLGLQTKGSNQLDSGCGMQSAIFDNFARATYDSYDLGKSTTATPVKYGENDGCWFKFAGKLNANLQPLTWKTVTLTDTSGKQIEVDCDKWFPENDAEYVVVRKIAKKIMDYRTMDDLRSLARTLAASYNGYSYFSSIAEGSLPCKSADEMKIEMLKLLPSKSADKSEHAHNINCFKRVSNAEAHTIDNVSDVVFKDSKSKTSHKLLLTQINKADVVEHNLAPEWKNGAWTQTTTSPITPEEFWVLLFNLASESTVQQRVITEVVKTAFGDEKLIVYDAQLYNQFDSVWIKDWTKKTMGA